MKNLKEYTLIIVSNGVALQEDNKEDDNRSELERTRVYADFDDLAHDLARLHND